MKRGQQISPNKEWIRNKFLLFCVLFFYLNLPYKGHAQEKQSWWQEHSSFSGYIKYLNTNSFQDLQYIVTDNLLHNRLNFKCYLNPQFTASIEIRNRIFWGNSVQINPNYADLVADTQSIDLNWVLVDKPALVMLSKIDRLNIDYRTDRWRVTAGRQRVNWGKTLVWNPNDLFNTYNFFDYDYEEHSGSDALRIQYFTSGSNSIETAINYTDSWDENTVALKYNFSSFSYDFQVLLAKYQTDYTLGIGWEGAISTLGFKGEVSYFMPKNREDNSTLVASVALDYYFKNGVSINVSSLFNENGVKDATLFNPNQFAGFQLDPKHLMPNRWSGFIQASKAFTPALSGTFSSMYAIDLKGVFMMPQLSYSISQNWDMDITSQLFYGQQNDTIENMFNTLFLRFRWSF